MQHLISNYREEDVEDEAATEDLLQEVQKAMMSDRWQRGESLHDIARLFDRGHYSIQRIQSETGGIRPLQRVRSSLALSFSEHEEIARGVVAGRSMRSIAATLGRAPSTVSRVIRRHGGCQGYRASHADQVARVE